MKLATISMAMALLVFVAPAVAADSQPGGHVAEVEAFARIMVDVRTAAEHCPDLPSTGRPSPQRRSARPYYGSGQKSVALTSNACTHATRLLLRESAADLNRRFGVGHATLQVEADAADAATATTDASGTISLAPRPE